jgi:hypothetical protein
MHWVAAAVDVVAGELARPNVIGATKLLCAQAIRAGYNCDALAVCQRHRDVSSSRRRNGGEKKSHQQHDGDDEVSLLLRAYCE